jgi:Uma2 family endonuclease
MQARKRPEPSPNGIPPLEQGDHLRREEFERRYEAMPRLKKAELIQGVVYMPSPTRHRRHGLPHGQISTWLGVYAGATPGVEASFNVTTRLDDENEPQPDAVLLISPERGGQASISDDDYLEGAPELAAEVASSSVSYDLHSKLEVYRIHSVREYIVWRVLDCEIDWFVLRRKRFIRHTPDDEGILRSEVFPGLWLDPAALVGGDWPRVLAVLQRGLATPEHAAFVAQLAAAGE